MHCPSFFGSHADDLLWEQGVASSILAAPTCVRAGVGLTAHKGADRLPAETVILGGRASRRGRNQGRPWADAVSEFLAEKRSAGCSRATIEVYSMCLQGLRARDWLDSERIASPADLTSEKVRQLHTSLIEAGLSNGTRHIYFRVLKTFCRWCKAEGFEVGETAINGRAPRLALVEPPTFTPGEIRKLLSVCRHKRDAFVVELLLHTGIRLGEACHLAVDDLMQGPQGAWIRVFGKGSRARIVPVDTPQHKLSRKWDAYVRNVRPRDTDRRELLLSPMICRRPPIRGYRPLTDNAIQLMLNRLGKDAGVANVHAHRFRHTWATDSLRAGVGMEALRRAGGWSSYEMLRRYLSFVPDDLIEAWSRRRD